MIDRENQPSLEATTAVSSSPRQSCSMPSAIEGALPPFSISERTLSLTPSPFTKHQSVGFQKNNFISGFWTLLRQQNCETRITKALKICYQCFRRVVKICQLENDDERAKWQEDDITAGWRRSRKQRKLALSQKEVLTNRNIAGECDCTKLRVIWIYFCSGARFPLNPFLEGNLPVLFG